MFFQIIAIIILIAFYGTFFAKQFLQKKKGSGAKQSFSFTNIDIESAFGLILTAAIILAAVAEFASALLAGDLRMLPMPLRVLGLLLSIIGTAVFGLSAYTLRDSWSTDADRTDGTGLIRSGIYSWSRNPAFFGFDLLFAGMLLMFYSAPLLLVSAFAAVMFHIQIMVEERHLSKTYGAKYTNYKKSVRRYFGRRKVD